MDGLKGLVFGVVQAIAVIEFGAIEVLGQFFVIADRVFRRDKVIIDVSQVEVGGVERGNKLLVFGPYIGSLMGRGSFCFSCRLAEIILCVYAGTEGDKDEYK